MTEPGNTSRWGAWQDDRELARARLRRHIEIITEARPEVAVSRTNGSDDLADMDHMYRDGVILIRDADLDRVSALVPGEVEASLINGITAYRPTDTDTEAALQQIDDALGVGVATPDHVVHVTGASGCCPATEPDDVEAAVPFPAMNETASAGSGVLVSVVDTGYLPSLAERSTPVACTASPATRRTSTRRTSVPSPGTARSSRASFDRWPRRPRFGSRGS